MGFHNCKHPGCGFWLPVTYPLSLCPWHIAPGSLLGAGAATAIGLLIAGGYVIRLTQLYREGHHDAEVRAGQAAWRELKRKYKQKNLERAAAERALHSQGHSAAIHGRRS